MILYYPPIILRISTYFRFRDVEDQRRTFLKSLKRLLSAVFLAIGYSKDIRERHYAIIQKIMIDDVLCSR